MKPGHPKRKKETSDEEIGPVRELGASCFHVGTREHIGPSTAFARSETNETIQRRKQSKRSKDGQTQNTRMTDRQKRSNLFHLYTVGSKHGRESFRARQRHGHHPKDKLDVDVLVEFVGMKAHANRNTLQSIVG